MNTTDALRYPIGKFSVPSSITATHITEWIESIEAFPASLRTVVAGMSEAQLDTPYRPGGWTVRQVIHHVADSHMNSYIRFKWTLTEDKPTIKAYEEKDWAELPEAKHAPVEISLALIESLHKRWVMVLKQLGEAELARSFVHPESGRSLQLDWMIALYAWHGQHHLGHVKLIAEQS